MVMKMKKSEENSNIMVDDYNDILHRIRVFNAGLDILDPSHKAFKKFKKVIGVDLTTGKTELQLKFGRK
jgi:hypothetical protein